MVEFKDRPPSGSFVGKIMVKSPWDPKETLTVSVLGQLLAGLSAFPSVITLDGSVDYRANLTIVCGSASGKLDFELDPSSGVTLLVKEDGGDELRRVHRVEIRLNEVNASDYVRTQIVFRQRDTAQRVAVPIVVTPKKQNSATAAN